MSNPALWQDPRTSFKVLWKVMSGFIQPLYDLLRPEIDDETVLVGSLWAFGARLLQEKYGVPYVSVQVSPSTFLSAHLPPVHKRFTIPSSWPVSLQSGSAVGDRAWSDRSRYGAGAEQDPHQA